MASTAVPGPCGEAPGVILVDPRRVPVRVAQLEWSGPTLSGVPGQPGGERLDGTDAAGGRLVALVRVHGCPLGFVQVNGPGEDAAGMLRLVVDAARRELGALIEAHKRIDAHTLSDANADANASDANALVNAPLISVVICTRNRTHDLGRCLASVLDLDYPRFEVIVVDNDPADDAAESLVARLNADLESAKRLVYVREPVRGLATARNRGIALARGPFVAFTDDDVVVDRGWLAAIAQAFADDERTGCVTGLIMPAELETPAQAMFEAHGGFPRGFGRRSYALDAPTGDPLFPFTVGGVGAGANMAFRAEVLERIGGFDPATGAGSRAKGGDDLLAFFRTLTAGSVISYRPEALVWHHHRRVWQDLATQAYGYGLGLGAYLTAAVTGEPRLLPALLRRLPRGTVHASKRLRSGEVADAWPKSLRDLERRGMLRGPLAYLGSRLDICIREVRIREIRALRIGALGISALGIGALGISARKGRARGAAEAPETVR